MSGDVDLKPSERVIAVGIREVIPELLHRVRIEDAVFRIHRITIDATELVSLHIARCMESNIELPNISAQYYKMAMQLVTEGNGTLKSVDPELQKTRNAMERLQPVSRVNLDQLMMAQCNSLAASFNTNLYLHFRRRVARYIRLLRQPDPDDREARKTRKLENLIIASDVCKKLQSEFESPATFHPMIHDLRDRLETQHFTSDFMEDNVKSFQSEIIRATHRMNAAFEAAEQHCLSVCPLRRRVTPSFVQIDTKGIGQVLGMDSTDYEKYRERKAARRRRAHKARDERNRQLRNAAGFPVFHREKAVFHVEITGEDAAHSAALRIQRAWRLIAHAAICKIARQKTRKLRKIQSAVRQWVQEQKAERKRCEAGLRQSKEDVWKNVLHLNRKKIKSHKCEIFAGSLRTDGVSVRLFFKSAATATDAPKRKKRKRSGSAKRSKASPLGTVDDPVPSRGLYVIDQLKHLSRIKEAQIIGADPGKRELLVCVDADAPEFVNEKRQRKPSVRYTAAQRRKEMLSDRHTAERVANTPPHVISAMREMADSNSRSASYATLKHYFDRRREWLPDALTHFQQSRHRYRRWQRFMGEQVSFQSFVSRIRSLRRGNDNPFVIAYGSWANVAGRPGAACNRGLPPCIGIGLRKKLSKHFCVVTTPERMTSKTCSLCQSKCLPCNEVDAFHRANKIANAGSDPLKLFNAQHFSVRGLRRCSNVECAVHLNRDYNAAINIQRRCKSMLSGGQLPAMDAIDEQLDAFQMEIECGE